MVGEENRGGRSTQGRKRAMGIRLTAIAEEDLPELYRWISDADLVHYNSPFRLVHERDHHEWFERTRRDPCRVLFAIRPYRRRRLVGLLQLFDIDPVHRSAELSIRIGAEQDRSRGAGRAAVDLALQHAWRELNLRRVWLRVFSTNQRAIAAYRRAGFHDEGRLREAAYIDGTWADVMLMGCLRSQHKTRQPADFSADRGAAACRPSSARRKGHPRGSRYLATDRSPKARSRRAAGTSTGYRAKLGLQLIVKASKPRCCRFFRPDASLGLASDRRCRHDSARRP